MYGYFMKLYRSKKFLLTGLGLLLLFSVLLALRLGLITFKQTSQPLHPNITKNTLSSRDTWMNIFQKDRKIGYAHHLFTKTKETYHTHEQVYMRINTLGVVQDINLDTKGTLNLDFTLRNIFFEIRSGLFEFSVKGSVQDKILKLETTSAGTTRKMEIKLKQVPYLAAGVMDAVWTRKPTPGQTYNFHLFDPGTMGQAKVTVKILAREKIVIMDQSMTALKVKLNFKGASQTAWIGPEGEIVQQEGLLGIRMVKTTQQQALYGLPVEPSADMTRVAAVRVEQELNNVPQLTLLKVALDGINTDAFKLNEGRQSYADGILTIRKEVLPGKASLQPMEQYKTASALIQSDHPDIQKLATQITTGAETDYAKARQILAWVFKNIEKKPVLSMPDALSTLKNRVGDCNEHAMLLAALARAAGISARVEAGLVYLDQEGFFYHAWNRLYLDQWVTVDAVFNQMPTDVTHIRFSTGGQAEQLDLIGLIGNLKLKILEFSP